VHRDLKPENLFLTSEGRLKVLDFGIARLREQSRATGAGTRAGSVLGTPAFMAPEQALGRWNEVDQRTDIWAVGATAFTLLSGRFVHEAQTIQEQLVLSATRSAPPLRSVAPGVPEALAGVVDRALAFDRAHRFPDARLMRGALRQAAVNLFGGTMTPVSMRAPVSSARLSHPDEQHGATLVAPFEVTSAITGRAEAMSTGQPVTRSTTDSVRSKPRSGVLVAALAVLGVLAAGFAVVATRHTGGPNAELQPSALPPRLPSGPVPAATAIGSALPAVAPLVPSTVPPVNVPRVPSVTPPPPTQAGSHAVPHFGAHPILVDKLKPPPLQAPPVEHENPFDRRH